MEKLLYTYFWKRMPVVFTLDQCLAGQRKSLKIVFSCGGSNKISY